MIPNILNIKVHPVGTSLIYINDVKNKNKNVLLLAEQRTVMAGKEPCIIISPVLGPSPGAHLASYRNLQSSFVVFFFSITIVRLCKEVGI